MKLAVKIFSTMDSNLTEEWHTSELYGTGTYTDWYNFILSLSGVIGCEMSISDTMIYFETEEHKNWFILRWS